MDKNELKEMYKLMFAQMEQKLHKSWSLEEDTRKLAATTVVAAGFGGDMNEDLCHELLDDMDFDKYSMQE